MLRSIVPALALALLAPALLSSAAPGPLPEEGSLTVSNGTYEATLTWPAPLSHADPSAVLDLAHAGRAATMEFDAVIRSDVALQADTVARPFLVDAQVVPGATPRVVLVYDAIATGAAGETTSTLTFTFHPDRIEYETSLHLPSAAIYAPYIEAETVLSWTSAWSSRGVLHHNGGSEVDNGAALDIYQGWGNRLRYGVYFEAPDAAVGVVRVAQGAEVNYLADGEWRAHLQGATTRTAFDTFVDLPTLGMPTELWTHDAILFEADVAALGARMHEVGPPPTTILPRASQDEQVVVALGDTGINPYHVAFRDTSPLAYAHPSTYIDGYPADAVAVHLTLDAPTLEAALAADRPKWAALKHDTLYWFPGTKIVGGISMDWASTEDPGRVFSTGHGTMTASRAAANEYSLCPECRIVALQILSSTLANDPLPAAYIRWAADQPWIDVQSHSWSGAVPFQNEFEFPGIRDAMEYAAAKMPVYSSAGNGAVGKLGVLGHPAFTRPMSGGEGVIAVGGHDNGRITAWTAQYPQVAADACASWAAVGSTHDSFDPEEGGGTSAATPYAAGEAGRIILEARRVLGGNGDRSAGILAQGAPRPDLGSSPLADGVFTLDELKSVQYRTATARPAATRDDGVICGPTWAPANTLPVEWTDYPSDVSAYPFIGWGGIDVHARDRALAVLHGAPMPVRPIDEQAHADAEALRAAYRDVEPYIPGLEVLDVLPPLPLPPVPEAPQNDAGSGGDAPDTSATDLFIESGVAYEGTLDMLHEVEDWYAFDGERLQQVTLVARGVELCIGIFAPSGGQVKRICTAEGLPDQELRITATLASTGVHTVAIEGFLTQQYAFSLGVGEEPAAIELPSQTPEGVV